VRDRLPALANPDQRICVFAVQSCNGAICPLFILAADRRVGCTCRSDVAWGRGRILPGLSFVGDLRRPSTARSMRCRRPLSWRRWFPPSPIGRVMKISSSHHRAVDRWCFSSATKLPGNDDLRADLVTPTALAISSPRSRTLGARWKKLGDGGGLGLGAVGLAAGCAASLSLACAIAATQARSSDLASGPCAMANHNSDHDRLGRSGRRHIRITL